MFGIDDLAIGAGAGAIGAGLLNYFGTQSTNDANAARADAANQWSAQQYATRYQTMTKDLEAAGLNPMLAYSQSPGSAPTAQQVTFQNPMSAATQGYSQVAGAEQSFASAHQAEEQVNLIKSTVKQVDATVDKIIEETKQIPVETDRIKFVIQKLAEEAANIAQDTQNKVVLRESMKAGINKMASETSLLNNQLAVEQALNNLGRTSKELAPAAKVLLDLFRSFK